MAGRKQIYLDEASERLLAEESRRTGLSVSELIRRAIQRCYGNAPTLPDPENGRSAEDALKPSLPGEPSSEDDWIYDRLLDDEYVDAIMDEYEKQRR